MKDDEIKGMKYPQFPKGFYFGSATAAFQIEGGWDEDDKGLSTWDTFMHKQRFAQHNRAAEYAVNTYHDFQTDIDLMVSMHMNAYRFSISWARVMPEGRVRVNAKGLDYYNRLVDALLDKGITPFITIFHWDMPQALADLCGGFIGRDGAYYFADYVEVVLKSLGDKVKYWITINEPWEHAMFGYFLGEHAPGKRNPWAYFKVAHHQLLGHGLAVELVRTHVKDGKVGITLSQFPVYPLKNTEKNLEAAHFADLFVNRFYLDGLCRGAYPEELWKRLWLLKPPIEPGDLEIISRQTDFLGVNYYSPMMAYYDWKIPFFRAWIERQVPPGPEYVEDAVLGPGPYPSGIYELAMRYKNEYDNPVIYITENGTKSDNIVQRNHDGHIASVQTPYQQRYLELYLSQLARAVENGADIRGYFIWSTMDLNEWTSGYTHPMGLIYVDHATQERAIKECGYWFRDLIKNQKANYE